MASRRSRCSSEARACAVRSVPELRGLGPARRGDALQLVHLSILSSVIGTWPDRVAPVRGSARRRASSDRPRRPCGTACGARRHESRDADAEPGADRGRASWSSVRATRSTTARVSASSSLRAASSTACADAASGARTRSLTVVSVISAIRRSRGSDGVVTPRSQRDTVIASTPSASPSSFWVRPALRLAVRSRPPTLPPLSWAPKLRALIPQLSAGCDSNC